MTQFVRLPLIVLIGVAAGCSKPARPYIERLNVDAFEGGEVISLTEDQLRAQLVTRLEAAKFTVGAKGEKAPADVKPWRLDLAAGLTEPELESGSAYVAVALDVRHTGDSEAIALTTRTRVKADSHDVEQIQSAIRLALDDALTLLVRQAAALIALENATPDVLDQKRADADLAVREAAIRLLIRKHDARALPPLLERLKTDDLGVFHETIGLLVELKAPSAVNPLIDAASQKNPVLVREVVFAIGSIGGSDAEAYLDLVASGHDDELVRASAEQALSELRARKPKTPSPGTTP